MEIQLLLPLTKLLLIETDEGSFELRGDGNYYITGTDKIVEKSEDIVQAISSMERSNKSDSILRTESYFKTKQGKNSLERDISDTLLKEKLEKLRTEAPTYKEPFFSDQNNDIKNALIDRKELIKILQDYFSIRGFSIAMLENMPEDIKLTVSLTSKVEGKRS